MSTYIYGASDDLVIVEGLSSGDEEFDCYGQYVEADLIAPSGAAMKVTVKFTEHGWRVQVGRADETIPMPDWGLHFARRHDLEHDDGEDDMLVVEAPDGTRIDNVRKIAETAS